MCIFYKFQKKKDLVRMQEKYNKQLNRSTLSVFLNEACTYTCVKVIAARSQCLNRAKGQIYNVDLKSN